ncbi:hypothetical protein FQ087_19250 [Sporosarcina sp. ANT_H38]|uniref:hypothetical protein n=1 Tax=Sporosarcina sp. ANT_H38 TaxID=2597358 RepID=UPI0011F37163|nr:hypothetical protein [Sporosarcina sp. ANT_H38]KAA0944255.1 hypothetical protein FQ087_19250 [Sporosarcina sp. ANT_H38]
MEKQLITINALLFSLLETTNLEEIEGLLAKIIAVDERKLEGIKISNIKIKAKPQPKYNKEIYSGRIFEIYLEEIKIFAYGVILKGNSLEDKSTYFLIGYLEYFTDSSMELEQIYDGISRREFSMIASTGYYSIRNYLWKPVGYYEPLIFSERELNDIPYVASFNEEHYLSIGDPLKETFLCDQIDGGMAAKNKNPMGIVGDVAIENMLVEIYNNQVNND